MTLDPRKTRKKQEKRKKVTKKKHKQKNAQQRKHKQKMIKKRNVNKSPLLSFSFFFNDNSGYGVQRKEDDNEANLNEKKP